MSKAFRDVIQKNSLNGRKKLSFCNRGLRELPEELFELTHLTELLLYCNKLDDLPPEFAQLSNLERLELDDNLFAQMPAAIFELRKLEVLNITANSFATVPPAISNLVNLVGVALPPITSLPAEIGDLPRLQHLHLRSSENLPFEHIGKLKGLRTLHLINCKLTTFPREILDLHELHDLVLTNCELTEVPPEVGQLRKLHYLRLDGNRLTSVPNSILDLDELRALSLHDNPTLPFFDIPPGRLPNLIEGSQGEGRKTRHFYRNQGWS